MSSDGAYRVINELLADAFLHRSRSFAIMVHSLANPEEVDAFLKETLGKRIEALALRMAARDAQIFERLLGPVENKPKPEHGVDPRLDRVSHPISAA